MNVICTDCGRTEILSPESWKCSCGGAWEPIEQNTFDPWLIDKDEHSIWRYRQFYHLGFEEPPARLGAGWTPLLPILGHTPQVFAKLEFLSPTGSFKDRGTELMISLLAHQGVKQVIDDSSGNAGASVAAYAGRAGMHADIYVPAHASASKLAQIGVYGATVHPVAGPRENARLAAQEAAGQGGVYASHAYHPAYLLGQQSVAWELWEQMDYTAPDWFIAPTAQGGNLLGCWLGFRRLYAAGLVSKMPRMVAVQSAFVAPVFHALQHRLEDIPAVEPTGTSVAEGIAITQPVRRKMLLRAIRETGGTCLVVQEDEILAAQAHLARQGIWVEPTSAAAAASLQVVLEQAGPNETIVLSLTGSGLKGKPSL